MHEVPLLINITLALVVAFCGGLIARRIGLPTIVGYLLAGIVIGPFTPGFVGDVATIQQLAELGVIFLMFGVGLHFSFTDLWRVRDIAIPGALLQTALASPGHHTPQSGRFCGYHVFRGCALNPLAARTHRPHAFAGTVYPGDFGHNPGNRHGRLGAVWRLSGAWRFCGRSHRQPVPPQSPGWGGCILPP